MRWEEAEAHARRNKQCGYYHHSHENERPLMRAILNGEIDINGEKSASLINLYADVLGPERIRSIKNSLICMITIFCRAVVEYGVDVELCYSLSDYYINEAEKRNTEAQLRELLSDVVEHYVSLVKKRQVLAYSLPVVRSIRHIKMHLYEPMLVRDVANAIGKHPNYLSSLFKKEVGIELSSYIRRQKLDEAKWLLLHSNHTVSEVAEMLGYRSHAYFTADFRKRYGETPIGFVRSVKAPDNIP
jgi:YesN/AraC family two-component response regulator